MTAVTLFGTLTSPYVRRVRMVALELGLHATMVDTAGDDGQQRLRAVNPLWKVPTAQVDGHTLFDSGVITRHLMTAHGPGPLSPLDDADHVSRSRITVTDGALDSLINTFYLAKDGISTEQSAYLTKQKDRAAASLSWLDGCVDGPWLGTAKGFGLCEIGLLTALEWMEFRHAYPVGRHSNLAAFMAEHRARPSARDTAPPA